MIDQPEGLNVRAVEKLNIDLSERLFSEGVSIAYDEDGDTLFLTIGEGKEAVNEQVVDGMYLRIEPDSLRIVGCVIVGFVSDILANNKLARKLFQEDFEELRRQGDSVRWEGSQAQRIKPLFELARR
ncbi:MAG: DUF2283 domain-containing protein [Chloroflexi bacterium]|nr:DUF2283 domain-containing protein [Chloroflexota bacterium]